MLVLWVIGIPVTAVLLLRRNTSNLDDYNVKMKYAFLYKGYVRKVSRPALQNPQSNAAVLPFSQYYFWSAKQAPSVRNLLILSLELQGGDCDMSQSRAAGHLSLLQLQHSNPGPDDAAPRRRWCVLDTLVLRLR